jgi:hypothetical protein
MWRLAPPKGTQSGELILSKKKGDFRQKIWAVSPFGDFSPQKKNAGGKYACCIFLSQ